MNIDINNIDSGNAEFSKVSIEKITCPVCGYKEKERLLCTVRNYLVYACNQCSVEYVSPAPDQAELKAYYDRKDWFEAGEEGGYQNYDTQTEWSIGLMNRILDSENDPKGLSILDVGCGYGTHLTSAAERGWKCFGVELSDHARGIAQSRLGNAAYIVESITDLIPHEFDLVLMFDILEHLPSPYSVFYELFSIGAITPKTKIVITTPNAASSEARQDSAGWTYRHPPSHLVFYTPESISFLLKRLQFSDVDIQGLHSITGESSHGGEIESFAGLIVQAQGSNFVKFMQERYVPGTWSKIAEYEHMPRYALACKLAVGKNVLDFGCGTGYGSARLADVASNVTGLDIDSIAHKWARDCHINPRLHFHLCDDLGASLAPESFDLITCFEMIEHVDHATQRATIASIERLLRIDGVLLISTPNPEITRLYGDNPYHLREMTEEEFLDLLSEHFPNVKILGQKVRTSITFNDPNNEKNVHAVITNTEHCSDQVAPLAFVAICSKVRNVEIPSIISFDDTDFISDYTNKQNKLIEARFNAYRFAEQLCDCKREIALLHVLRDQQQCQLQEYQQSSALFLLNQLIDRLAGKLQKAFSKKGK